MSRRALALLTLLLLLVPAAAGADGVNLRWDQCFGDGGAQFRDFACDTNAGSERLVGSFELPADMSEVIGLELHLHLGSSSPALPAWWELKNVATCRASAIGFASPVTLPAGSVSCVDWAGGLAAGGVGAYQIGSQGPNHVRILMSTAVVAPGAPAVAGQEYFAFSLTISHIRTVGAGACAGCLEPVAVFFSAVNVATPVQGANVLITQGTSGDDTRWVSWQHGHPIHVVQGCERRLENGSCFNPTTFFDVAPAVTATRGSTWGAVKSLYHR